MVKVGKILMRIGLLFRVIRKVSPQKVLPQTLKCQPLPIEKELETIASTVKDLSVSFPLIGQELSTLLSEGLIAPTTSPCLFPFLLLDKKKRRKSSYCYNSNLCKDHRKKSLRPWKSSISATTNFSPTTINPIPCTLNSKKEKMEHFQKVKSKGYVIY